MVPNASYRRFLVSAGAVLVLLSLVAWSRLTAPPPEPVMLNLTNLVGAGTNLHREAFVPLDSVRQLPEPIRRSIGKPIAAPGGWFNVGCERIPGIPNRRLVFAGANSNHVVVSYEVGGIGHYWVVALFERSGDWFGPVWVNTVQSDSLKDFASKLERRPIKNELEDLVW